jgi:cysteine desulfurase
MNMVNRRVYLDNAASGIMHPEVLEAMLPYFAELQGNPSAIHSHGRVLRAAVEKSRRTIADLLHCSPSEIIFTSGGTESDNMSLKGAVESQGVTHIITSPIEHHAVIHCAEELEKCKGIKVSWLEVDEEGHANIEQLETLLQAGEKCLVSLMHGNNEIGTLHDIQKIAELCQHYQAIFHTDTVQTMGHYVFDLQKLPVHFLVGSAHKFYGPKGIGFLYRRSDVMIPPLICGGSQERNQRAGTENVACIVGMAKALELCMKNLDSYHNHLQNLKTTCKDLLTQHIPGVSFNGNVSETQSLPTVLNVCFPVLDEESMLLMNLDIHGISASGGSACTSGSNKGSHVLNGIGKTPSQISNSIRFSFGIQNTEEEIKYVVEKLREILGIRVQ